MTTPEKRAREDKKQQKQREKDLRRRERRNAAPRAPELVSAEELMGNAPSIDEVMQSLLGGEARAPRSAAPLPARLFVGGLSHETRNEGLRAHFAPHGAIAEAVVIAGAGSNRNFGFVTMADRKDAAAAIEALHHSELDGVRIVVRVATERR